MQIYLYNTLTHKKEEFKSIEPNKVSMYSCGPTVYSYAHIGNFRAYMFADSLRRMLKYNGYTLNDVMNITDVGHLTSDADTGEDKMMKAARRENKDPWEIAQFYMDAFLVDFKKLNLAELKTITRATDNIDQMLEMVQEIVKNGYGYETSNGIYFDISKLDKYPVLSNNDLSGQEAGARIEVDEEKRNPYDFALWIKAPENHIMKWDSPWGMSYPGWHIECSAMSRRFLGEHFDIHTGGVDHIPVHHENEIAQCKGAFGHNPANYWMHCEFLQVDGGKMSKSLGNTYTISDLQEKGIEPLAFKLFNFQAHYRTKINFTYEGAQGAQKALERLRRSYIAHRDGTEEIDEAVINAYETRFHEAINDDLNMPQALGVLWDVLKETRKSKDFAKLILKFDTVFGLDLENVDKYIKENDEKNKIEIPDEIRKLVDERTEAKKNKDYAKADEIRNLIEAKGFIIKDTPNGVEINEK